MTNGLSLGPLFRHTVGFDHFDDLMDAALRADQGSSYPPYDIVREDEDHYRIDMAVAGFRQQDLNVTVQENQLTVSGAAPREERGSDEEAGETWLHRGIARRAFERNFRLAEHVQVRGASLRDGLLTIRLERVIPESSRPRMVEIEADNGHNGSGGQTLEHGSGKAEQH